MGRLLASPLPNQSLHPAHRRLLLPPPRIQARVRRHRLDCRFLLHGRLFAALSEDTPRSGDQRAHHEQVGDCEALLAHVGGGRLFRRRALGPPLLPRHRRREPFSLRQAAQAAARLHDAPRLRRQARDWQERVREARGQDTVHIHHDGALGGRGLVVHRRLRD